MRYLVEHGADATAKAKQEVTPLEEALECDNKAAAKFLMDTATDKDDQLLAMLDCWSYNGEDMYLEAAKYLLSGGAGATSQDSHGNTALHHAYDGEMATILVERGANVNAANHDGVTIS